LLLIKEETKKEEKTDAQKEEEMRARKGSVYQFSKSLGVSLPRHANKGPSSPSPSPFDNLPLVLSDNTEGYVSERLTRPSSSSSSPPSSLTLSSFSSSSSSAGSIFLIDQDRYTPYYRHYFHNKEHTNYLTYDLEGNPVFISVEKPPCFEENAGLPPMPRRGFVRTCNPWTEDSEADMWVIITTENNREAKRALSKELCELVGPKAKFTELPPEESEQSFLKLEDGLLMKAYKFGVLHCKKKQTTEEEIFNNTDMTPDFTEFLDFLGETVVLKGFEKFRGGLDVKNNTTGEKSVFTSLNNIDIMFHVGPMLPAGEDELQQLGRKRHIGNDIVVIIFLDSDQEEPLDPSIFVSDFNHVFCVVRKLSAKKIRELGRGARGRERGEGFKGVKGKTYYQIGFCSKNGVHSAEPALSYPGIYEKNEKLKRLFLTKALNSERSALYAQKFVSRLSMVRKELFKDVANDMLKLTASKSTKKSWFKKG